MMTPNKRKQYENDVFDDSFKNRRSSLKVNLSCTSELSDIGHGSLMRKSYIKCNEQESRKSSDGVITRKKTSAKIVQYNVIDTHKVVVTKNSLIEPKGNIFLKDLAVRLVDVYNKGKASKTECNELNNSSLQAVEINNKEETLKANCEKLKHAILKKSNDIFDEESILWKKTTSALLQGESSSIKVSFEPQIQPTNNSTINLPKSVNVSIDATPKGRNSQKIDTRLLNKDQLFKRRLFTNKQIMDDNKSLPDNFACQAYHSDRVRISPILTSNNKRHDTLKALQKTVLPTVENNNLESREHLQDILHKCLLDDGSIYASSPIACSSFIEDHVKISKNTIHYENICDYDIHKSMPICGELIALTDSVESSNMNLINKVEQNETGMQIVTVPNPMLKDLPLASVNSNKDEETSTKSKKLCRLSGGIVLNNESVSSVTINTVIPMDLTTVQYNVEIMKKTNKMKTASSYDSCLRSSNCVVADNQINKDVNCLSLHVNTSIDPVNATISASDENFHMQMSGCINEENKKDVSGFSLRVNTSCDSVRKSSLRVINEMPQVCSTYRSKQLVQSDGSYFDLLEDMSLIERTRNPWGTVDDRNSRKTNMNVSKRNSTDNTGASSYTEDTPYPVNYSALLGTQLKNNTLIHNLNTTKDIRLVNCNLVDDLKRRYNVFSLVKELNSVPELLVKEADPPNIELKSILSNLSQNSSSHVSNVQGQEDRKILQDSLSDIENKNNDLRVKILDSLKTKFVPKGKRKLLPLTENSELVSLIPASSVHSSPKLSFLPKKHIIRKKKNVKRTTIQKKNAKNVKNTSEKIHESVEIENSDICESKEGKSKKHRKILSKKIVVKKFVNQDILKQLQEKVQISCEEKWRCNRLSVDDFDKQKKISLSLFNKGQKIIIVTTGLSKEDKNLVRSVVKSLGKADIHANVTQRTTHIVSTGVRTINLLHGIIRGCWLVTLHWVLKSLEYNEWLPSEEYEMSHFSEAVQENRKDRQMFGASYVPELFVTCGPIYIESETTPPRNILKELIKAAGGRITENFENAKVIIGPEGLKESWILDCITTGKLQPLDQYNRV